MGTMTAASISQNLVISLWVGKCPLVPETSTRSMVVLLSEVCAAFPLSQEKWCPPGMVVIVLPVIRNLQCVKQGRYL